MSHRSSGQGKTLILRTCFMLLLFDIECSSGKLDMMQIINAIEMQTMSSMLKALDLARQREIAHSK